MKLKLMMCVALTIVSMQANANPAQNTGAASAFIEPATAKLNEKVTLTNNDFIYFQNNTATSRQYHYLTEVCVKQSGANDNCMAKEDDIELKPGEEFSISKQPILAVSFTAVGTYQTYAKTLYYSNNDMSTSAISISESDVTVS